MKNKITLFFICTLCTIGVFAQHKTGHISDLKNEIKALSKEQVNSYLNGEGMGLAKAAELNHYPGPKHVLEFSKELELTDEQINNTNDLIHSMKKEAISLGNKIIEKEKELDSLFINNIADEKIVQSLILEISQLNGELRFVHIKAHIGQKEILSAEQINLYDKLRGYK
jgi:hypothetical protein